MHLIKRKFHLESIMHALYKLFYLLLGLSYLSWIPSSCFTNPKNIVFLAFKLSYNHMQKVVCSTNKASGTQKLLIFFLSLGKIYFLLLDTYYPLALGFHYSFDPRHSLCTGTWQLLALTLSSHWVFDNSGCSMITIDIPLVTKCSTHTLSSTMLCSFL